MSEFLSFQKPAKFTRAGFFFIFAGLLACAGAGQVLADVLETPLASSASPEQAFQEAMALKSEGRLVESEGKLLEALQSRPGDPAYHFELANLYAMQHDAYEEISADRSAALLGRVAHELDQTLMLDPDFLPAQYNLAVTYKRLGDYERAREELRRLMSKAEAKQDFAMKRSALLQMGRIYEEQGFFDEARDSFLEAREQDISNRDALDALENLKQHQQWKEESVRRQNAGRSLSTLQQGLAEAGASSRQSVYPGSFNSSASRSGSQQPLFSSLGSMAQQFLSRNNSESR